MINIPELIEDALAMRNASQYRCFVTNTAAKKLLDLDESAFHAIRSRLEAEPASQLLEKLGLSSVLQALFGLGNKYCVHELVAVLATWPPELLERLLAQGPIALRDIRPASELIKKIGELTTHEDELVRRWASRFHEKWNVN